MSPRMSAYFPEEEDVFSEGKIQQIECSGSFSCPFNFTQRDSFHLFTDLSVFVANSVTVTIPSSDEFLF